VNKWIITCVLVCGFLFPGFLPGQESVGWEYKIGAGDLLEINVFGVEELNQKVRVEGNGTIALTGLGEVRVEGLTRSELEKELVKLLEEQWLQEARVSVFILEYYSRKVYLNGALRNAGPHDLIGNKTLLQIISEVGGLTEEAGKNIFVIRRQEDGSNSTQEIPIEELFREGDSRLNIQILPNDIVNVPVDKMVKIFVFGEVKNPSALEVRQSEIPTLLKAIVMAGGFTDRAIRRAVQIRWVDEEGASQTRKVNVKEILKNRIEDPQLKENDVVYVPGTKF
jgi:polysaccharide export outer membrane protein